MMMTLKVELGEETISRVEQAAQKLGITPEEFLQVSIEEMLIRLEQDFVEAAKYVLDKNADLYKGLA
jgi:hypothetical protein